MRATEDRPLACPAVVDRPPQKFNRLEAYIAKQAGCPVFLGFRFPLVPILAVGFGWRCRLSLAIKV
jgi:hypothetical protein